MKITVQEATLLQLDYLVAVAEGATDFRYDTVATYWVTMHGKDRALAKGWAQSFTPTTDWSHGGPILDRENITVGPHTTSPAIAHYGPALVTDPWADRFVGPTKLIAGMRCLATIRLGSEVDIPEGLA